jgi:hypothetical protein
MADSTKSIRTSSFPTVSILTMLFVTLKLCGVIDWSWWWVLSPLWIMAAIVVLILLLAVSLAVVGWMLDRKLRTIRKGGPNG